jgi:2-polyprenyl-3-methyl-5-hydroxy-6-metoxy-1,4-benzoquinol methylase
MRERDAERVDDLTGSVREWFNQPHEIELRTQELEKGLTEPESRMLWHLPPQSRVLDIGCAAGRASIALAREGHTVTGIDVAERLIKEARTAAKETAVGATFQVCDSVNAPFPEGAFNAALLLKTYCYVPKRANRIAWLHEIARVVKPGGWLFLSQYIIDDVVGSYEPIREENRRRFPSTYATLEDGDGFSLPFEGSPTVGFVHYFMEADLRDELAPSPFQLVDSFRQSTVLYCTLQKRFP